MRLLPDLRAAPKRLACFASLAALVAGCSSSDGPDLIPVGGLVHRDGTPVEGVLVEFRPAQGRPSFGRSDAEGRYVAAYTPNQSGVVAGTVPVFVTIEDPIEEPTFNEDGDPVLPEGGMPKPSTAQKYPEDLEASTGSGEVEFDVNLSFLPAE